MEAERPYFKIQQILQSWLMGFFLPFLKSPRHRIGRKHKILWVVSNSQMCRDRAMINTAKFAHIIA